MKKLKQFKILWDFIEKDKFKLIVASFIIFIAGISSIFTGYLNGAAVEAITKNALQDALKYLGIYFLIELFIEGFLHLFAHSLLQKIESHLTRQLG